MLEITDPSPTELNGVFVLYVAALGGLRLGSILIGSLQKVSKNLRQKRLFLANICDLSEVEKKIDCARDLPWL